MKLIRHYDEVPEFVRGMDINVHIFLEAICVKSIDVYYDVIDDGSSIISTVTTYDDGNDYQRLCHSVVRESFMNIDYYKKLMCIDKSIFDCLRGSITEYILENKGYVRLCPYDMKPCRLS